MAAVSAPAATHELLLEFVIANNAADVNVAYVNDVSYTWPG